jgi:hypothetical protein
VTRGGFRYSSAQKLFLQSDTLKNTSGAAITGPIYLVLDNLSSNATLANANGTTGCNLPASPYITVMNSGSLAAGASVQVSLEFNDPSMAGITYNTRVLAGQGQQ